MTRWAFLGAGEFESWQYEVDAAVLGDRSGSVVVLATASAPEGATVYDGWRERGRQHYAQLDRSVSAPDLRVRENAFDPAIVATLDDAALVFFSGGNPAHLAAALLNTPFWTTLLHRLDAGTAYAGCSAGVACLSDPTFDSAAEDDTSVWAPGLGLFPDTLFAPHWDTVDAWRPDAQEFITSAVPPQGQLVALDEYTAMVGDGQSWTVLGAGGVHCFRPGGEWVHHDEGSSFRLLLRTDQDSSAD